MTLFGLTGGCAKKVNTSLVRVALCLAPALFIDSANCANPHKYNEFELTQHAKLDIIPAESLYRFKPTIENLNNTKHKIIFIATFNHLFDFDNKEENHNVFVQCWELLAQLAKNKDIYLAIQKGTIHHQFALKHHITFMGHTAYSQRIVTDSLLKELADYGKALRADERYLYTQMLKEPLKHFGSISNASSLHTWALLLLSIILEQQKKLHSLENELLDTRRVPGKQ